MEYIGDINGGLFAIVGCTMYSSYSVSYLVMCDSISSDVAIGLFRCKLNMAFARYLLFGIDVLKFNEPGKSLRFGAGVESEEEAVGCSITCSCISLSWLSIDEGKLV